MLRLCSVTLICWICLAGTTVRGQGHNLGIVQVSSVRASPAHLSCRSQDAKAIVTVQVWISGAQKSIKGQPITVGLYQAWGLPPGNRIMVVPQRKEVELNRSPAVLEYTVQCGRKTVPGDVALTAWIEAVPTGVKIRHANPPASGQVKIHIDR